MKLKSIFMINQMKKKIVEEIDNGVRPLII